MWVLTYPVSVVCYILSVLNAIGGLFAPAVPSVFFCVSGGIAIGGAQSGNKCLVVATMVMSIISALSALLLLIYATFVYMDIYSSFVFLSILLLLIMVIVPTISASLTCKPLCCQKRPTERVVQPNQAHYYSNPVYFQPEQVHYQPSQVSNQVNQAQYHPNQVHYNPNLVSAANMIPNSGQALALNMNVQAQPTSSDMVSLTKQFQDGY